MLVEFLCAILLIGLGLTQSYGNIFQNFFFVFVGLITLTLASYRLDKVLGNGPFNQNHQPPKNMPKYPPTEQEDTPPDNETMED